MLVTISRRIEMNGKEIERFLICFSKKGNGFLGWAADFAADFAAVL